MSAGAALVAPSRVENKAITEPQDENGIPTHEHTHTYRQEPGLNEPISKWLFQEKRDDSTNIGAWLEHGVGTADALDSVRN